MLINISLGYRIPPMFNPADFYIETLAVTPNDREASLKKLEVHYQMSILMKLTSFLFLLFNLEHNRGI